MNITGAVVLFSIFWSLSIAASAANETKQVQTDDFDKSAGHNLALVNTARLVDADAEPENWMTHGRTFSEQRFSPLTSINGGNVKHLGLGWYYDFPSGSPLEATPIAIDGVLYVTGSWSIVYAFDGATGELLWRHDPQVPRKILGDVCCGPVNRGVAAWNGKIFVGTLDGRLVALNAKTGDQVWSVKTTPEQLPYSITGAPRIVKGKVIIGNGGSEFGIRGYVSAYDTETGGLAWRFYTVPGDPDKPFESDTLEMAAKTWSGDWWKYGGGGTVWDSMAYDPELDLLYIGVGNGAPWNREIRSAGGGDNLFLSSIVAIRPDSGDYVWHYQTTPGESWDYTATQHMILAELEISGKNRSVIMQAPKNGFFYILDRETGELLSANKYTKATWASHVDMTTGRPVENPAARYIDSPQLLFPAPMGGHNWQPMSYSPDTGLVYLPVQEIPLVYGQDKDFDFESSRWNTGVDLTNAGMPDDKAQRLEASKMIRGSLVAWDPIKQEKAWQVQHDNLWNGGVLSTTGNLVFQGNGSGEFVAFRADTGERLWSTDAQSGVVAAPISYGIKGEQYIAVLAGWGGAFAASAGELAQNQSENISRLLVYKLQGGAQLPPLTAQQAVVIDPPGLELTPETVEKGRQLYMDHCHFCHGDRAVSGSKIPDLRYLSREKHTIFNQIVLQGVFQDLGMPGFSDYLSVEDAEAIQAYIIERARHTLKENQLVE